MFERKPYQSGLVHYLKLETLTPLHIGAGERLRRGVDFFVSKNELRMYDSARLFTALCKTHSPESALLELENAYAMAHISVGQDFDWLHGRNLLEKGIFEAAIIKRIGWKDRKEATLEELAAFVNSGTGHVMIPGSSLKGAIRGAILDKVLTPSNPAIKKAFSDRVPDKDRFTNEVFRGSHGTKAINYDMLRLLRIGDAEFEKDCTEAILVRVYNHVDWSTSHPKWKDLKGQQFLEVVPEGKTCVLRFELAGALRSLYERSTNLNSFPTMKGPHADIKTLLKILNEQTKLLIERELNFWAKDASANKPLSMIGNWEKLEAMVEKLEQEGQGQQAIIRLGHGGGYFGITGGWQRHLDHQIQKELYHKRKKYKGKKGGAIQQYFPKTRKAAANQPMGFIRLSLISGEEYHQELAKLRSNAVPDTPFSLVNINFEGGLKRNSCLRAIYLGPVPNDPQRKRFQICVNGNSEEISLAYRANTLSSHQLVELEVRELRNGKVFQLGFKRLL